LRLQRAGPGHNAGHCLAVEPAPVGTGQWRRCLLAGPV
jgi:hypothetical protein